MKLGLSDQRVERQIEARGIVSCMSSLIGRLRSRNGSSRLRDASTSAKDFVDWSTLPGQEGKWSESERGNPPPIKAPPPLFDH